MFLPWFLCGIMFIIMVIMSLKLYLLKISMKEICSELEEHLFTDTNTLISISSGDKHLRYLTAKLNKQLRILRQQRQKYRNGDLELKEAITNISHDLRTPLTAIFGYLDLLEQEEKSKDIKRYLSCIEERAQALQQLTEELFRYSIIVSTAADLELEMVNVNGVLEESITDFYEALTKKGITPIISISEKILSCRLNKAALSRIFSNILNNALKYSDGDLEISLLESGEIIFANTAADLNEVQIGKLFDRFFTVEAARNSTGLGLAIAKALVEQMNGTITAQYKDSRLSIRIAFAKERKM